MARFRGPSAFPFVQFRSGSSCLPGTGRRPGPAGGGQGDVTSGGFAPVPPCVARSGHGRVTRGAGGWKASGPPIAVGATGLHSNACRALGLPLGNGSPKNDDACREILGLPALDGLAAAAPVRRAAIRVALFGVVGDDVQEVTLPGLPLGARHPVDGRDGQGNPGAVKERLAVQRQAVRAALPDRLIELDCVGPLFGVVVAQVAPLPVAVERAPDAGAFLALCCRMSTAALNGRGRVARIAALPSRSESGRGGRPVPIRTSATEPL
jgi:hypothetical protein